MSFTILDHGKPGAMNRLIKKDWHGCLTLQHWKEWKEGLSPLGIESIKTDTESQQKNIKLLLLLTNKL